RGNEAFTNTRQALEMLAWMRFRGDQSDLGIVLTQPSTRTHHGAARSQPAHEDIYLRAGGKDLRPGPLVMALRVPRRTKLIEKKSSLSGGDLTRHLYRPLDAGS